ncbi:uncharacterized protein [Drosophila virilis]|uniref:Uncharacterized protein n=1 Tax=Drosophila virilis TaxID=7244 RepID=B4MFK4_DROVI|nr:uncharacterized protein LOC6636449 [Drosophila virilis]XP_032290527.1 uncharacterized protein LOC116650585 [Drosophila virilis]EDW57175.1 uncharacterized protein Dvir_GJ15020 [Drosophila virilis]
MNYTWAFALILATLCLSQAAPLNNPYQAISSPSDISGQPVRTKRGSYQNDYYICYPSSVVYGYHHNNPSSPDGHRRSDAPEQRFLAYDSYEARTNRADRERAAYTDSFGK